MVRYGFSEDFLKELSESQLVTYVTKDGVAGFSYANNIPEAKVVSIMCDHFMTMLKEFLDTSDMGAMAVNRDIDSLLNQMIISNNEDYRKLKYGENDLYGGED